MNGVVNSQSRIATRIAGWSLIIAAVGFTVVFSYLASAFGYPEVLDGKACEFIGEFLGEIALSGFFVATAYPMVKAANRAKWLGVSGMIVGIVGLIAAFRNVTTVVGPVAAANNVLLPIWLIALGVVLVRIKR